MKKAEAKILLETNPTEEVFQEFYRQAQIAAHYLRLNAMIKGGLDSGVTITGDDRGVREALCWFVNEAQDQAKRLDDARERYDDRWRQKPEAKRN